jgi:uncharacterized protein (UPF0332 family)
MKSAKTYLKWCLAQKKGIRIVKESENLQNAYLKKSKEALRSMQINAKEGIGEWVIATGYYAKYFAIYALLSRLGIKCEIHDCTIAMFGFLFANDLPRQLMDDLRQAKDDRIEAQYYTTVMPTNSQEVIAKTTDFVLKIEEIIDGLNSQKITDIQKNIKTLLG